MKEKLIVQLVTWNGAKYIPFLFDSLRKQTYIDFKLIVLDNASNDETATLIQMELEDVPFECEFKQVNENTGFAGGHNRLYKEYSSEYFLLLNQDMYLMPTCLEDMVKYMDAHTDVAAVSPRLMRWDVDMIQDSDNNIQESFTDDIDALGLKVFRSRRVIEWMTRQRWSEVAESLGQRDPSTAPNGFAQDDGRGVMEVFGVSGAFPMFCREAIDEVAFADGTFLDESYHSYKEDVDLAFRLRSAGHKSMVLLDTVAYHDRSGAGPKELSDAAARDNKRKQSNWLKHNSYKNHIATLYKNEYGQNVLLDVPFILWYELKKFGWLLLFDRSVLKGLRELNWKELRVKRTVIKEKRNVSAKAVRTWWK